ncbi:MAG TPA: NAD-dependent epimerase/dehydratase family protein [Longimicrobiaceae bacterium]
MDSPTPRNGPATEDDLDAVLSEPFPEDVAFARSLRGDVLVLGAGGKMGPTLARRVAASLRAAGSDARVVAVSRFADVAARERLEACGVDTLSADLLEGDQLAGLPDAPNVLYLVGMKFGATGQEPLTWAMNAYLPGRVAERFASSRIVALSTGNVYPLVPVESGGCDEEHPTAPVGEYAQSCLGRERIFQHFSLVNGTPVCLIRLNYAVEPRYGVLLDIARKVQAGEPVPLSMGWANVIWQGDANSVCFRALDLCDSPAAVLNLTGPEILSVRDVATYFAERFGRRAHLVGVEGESALLNDASRAHRRFGAPHVTAAEAMARVADWLEAGGRTLGKPTKFEVHDGRF